MDLVKLNLGCGKTILDGYRNYDKYPVNDTVGFIDLNKLPLPFDSDSVDEVVIHHVLEHLDCNPFDFMMEIHRILRKGGLVSIELPACDVNLLHRRFFHTGGYFGAILKKSDVSSDMYNNDFFELVSFKSKSLSLRDGLGRVFDFLRGLMFEEHSWVLKKT